MKFNKLKIPSGQYILVGKNAFEELAKKYPERILTVYKSRSYRSDSIGKFKSEIKEEEWIEAQAGTGSHQGIMAIIKRPNLRQIKDLHDKTGLVIALDGVLDPQNIGSIFRIAECFGAVGIIYSNNRSPGITPVVTKASVGASELVDIYEVSNLANTLENLKEKNWWVASTICHGDAIELSKFDPPNKIILVLGAEGDGISARVIGISDYKVYLPMLGQIDSLNVAQAAAVFGYEITKNILSKK